MTVSSKTESILGCVIGSILMSALFLGATNRSAGQPPATQRTTAAPRVNVAEPATTAAATSPEGKTPTATTLDQSLAQAMDKNPGIIAAKAKVALAQAELSSTQLEVARQLVALWSSRQIQENAVNSARIQLARVQEVNRTTPGSVSSETLENAKSALIDAEAKASRTQTELRYLTGQVNPMAVAGTANSVNTRSATVQAPRGPIVEKIQQALDTKVAVDVAGPIKLAIDLLQDSAKIPIVVDERAIPDDTGVAIKLKGVTLGAALQAIEDQIREGRFVVRDYGLFLTDRVYAAEEGFLPLAEFIKAKTGNSAESAVPSKP